MQEAAPAQLGRANGWYARRAMSVARWLILPGLLLCPLAGDAPVAAALELPEANAARLGGDERHTRFVADLNRRVQFRAYVIPEPYRVVVDLEEVNFRFSPGLGGKGIGLIRAYRYGSMDDGRSRIVMDTKGPIEIGGAFVIDPENNQPARLVIDVLPTTPAKFAALYKQNSLERDDFEQVQGKLGSSSSDAEIPETELNPDWAVPALGGIMESVPEIESAAPLPMPRPGKTAIAPRRSIPTTRAKKPGMRTVVIDPGHGGIDPGALGKNGTREKDVVLAFAQELKRQIEERPGYEVILTRSGDTFVSLRDRVRIARHNAADLFVVVHADAVRNKSVRGATVYTLSETASDAEAEELARNESKSDLIAGVDLAEESDEIAGILIDLAQREAKNHAGFFARRVVDELKPATRFTGKPLRSAGFRVLRAPDVPSILLELGYLSHDSDESQLRSAAWRSKIAAQLARAVDTYFTTSLASKRTVAPPVP